ncbi:hypothetical protein CBA19CS11_29565 [Caballeronia novacaledonica]|nr:hypothetical protein CBA19CS11_29565 [Caballeronia novacaledonica]
MLVEVAAVFQCRRDALDAFRAIKEAGISPDLVHLIEPDDPVIRHDDDDWGLTEGHSFDEAEYAAHGEHLGSRCADTACAGCVMPPALPITGDRFMVVVRDCRCSLAASNVVETLYAHGAIAARSSNEGPWRRSPYRRAATQL